MNRRKSWDTTIKHFYRLGLEQTIPQEIRIKVPRSNIFRWKNEPDDKYIGEKLLNDLSEDLELYQSIGQTRNLKKIIKVYFRLLSILHEIIKDVKGYKKLLRVNGLKIIEAIDRSKPAMGLNKCLAVFNMSKSTYYDIKFLEKYQCTDSFFKQCVERWPKQPAKSLVIKIKTLLINPKYRYWSRSSAYYIAKRNGMINFSISTWYRYCNMLGISNKIKSKIPCYRSLVSSRPNEVWCADVTIFKSENGQKLYLHILMDHFSRYILGYKIESKPSGRAVSSLVRAAAAKYKPKLLTFLTDGGSENVNSMVSDTILSLPYEIKHCIAQKDIRFSNSMIEALNKVLKYQFLYPLGIENRMEFIKVFPVSVKIYNKERPQLALGGQTPYEAFLGWPILSENDKISSEAPKEHLKCNLCIEN